MVISLELRSTLSDIVLKIWSVQEHLQVQLQGHHTSDHLIYFYSRTLQHLNYWHPPPLPSKFYFYFSTMLHLTNSDTLPNSNFTVSPPGFSSFSQASLSCTCFVFVMWNIEWSTVNTLTSQVAAFSERDTQVGVLSTKFISEKLGEITIKFVCWLSLSQRWDAL